MTTRARRASEIDGVHYHFLSQREFERLRDSDDLLEWAEVHGNFYGSPREPVERAMAAARKSTRSAGRRRGSASHCARSRSTAAS